VPTQLDLFRQAGVGVIEPEPKTAVRLGSRERRVSLAQKRREALKEFIEVLSDLEGKDIFIGYYGGPGSHYWVDNLKLGRMRVEQPVFGNKEVPGVIVLRGNRAGVVRIFTEHVYGLRCQEYFGYTEWLLDFWNGFGEHPIDPYLRPGGDSIHMKQFHD